MRTIQADFAGGVDISRVSSPFTVCETTECEYEKTLHAANALGMKMLVTNLRLQITIIIQYSIFAMAQGCPTCKTV